MKNGFLRILALLTLLSLTFGYLISCGGSGEAAHTHSFSETYSIDGSQHWKECSCGEKAEIENHIGGIATCTEKAKCDVCKSEYGDMLNHSYGSLIADEENHWRECICGEKKSLAEHKYDVVSATTKLNHTYSCICGKELAPLAHEFSIVKHFNATRHWYKCECGYEDDGKPHVLENGICACGYRTPEADHVHNFNILKSNGSAHWYECECKEASKEESHTGGAATCENKAKCDVCAMSYGELKEHSYDTVKITESAHIYECACSAKKEAEAHDFRGGACSCGYEKPSGEHEHSFTTLKFGGRAHWYECKCGVISGEENHTGTPADCDSRAYCDICKQEYGEICHDWNDGELTTPPTVDTAGAITYTCKTCGEKIGEGVNAGEKIITRADIEEALVSVAWAYYMKGEKLQYDSIALSYINNHYGGTCRHTREVSPEYGTSDTTIFSVCTGYPTKVYLETIGRYLWEGKYSANGVVTMWFWLAADNQSEEGFRDYYETELDPITENDRDTAILRWIDFERYLDDEENEVPYAYSLQTFDSSSFYDWYTGGELELRCEADGKTYSYYRNGNKITAAEAKGYALDYLTKKVDGKYVNLRPGDLITEDTHTLLYIGNGYVLDCNGYKFNIEIGIDDPEEKGSIFGRMKTIEATLSAAASDYVVVRPLDYYTEDYDGNPSNDIIRYEGENISITEPTHSRMEYPAMEIDRTVDITPYGTAVQNDTLTYTVKVSNRTNESNFKKWMQTSNKSYIGEAYTGIVITEKIPEGCELVSATDGYTLENGVLSWTFDISIGSSVAVSYTVKVTAEAGSTITSEGGTVANIPSNSISNKVGYAKLSDTQKSALDSLLASDPTEWKDIYGTDLDFAEGIYGRLGIDLELPSASEVVENLFKPTLIEKILSMTVYYNDLDTPTVMYMPVDEVSEEYIAIKNMLIYDYFGGYRLYTADLEKFNEVGIEGYDFPAELDNTILEFSLDYLEVGDIIVYATAKNRGDTDMTSELSSVSVLIYAGNQTIIEMASDGTAKIHTEDSAIALLDMAFKSTNDIFFALRPSQSIGAAAEAQN